MTYPLMFQEPADSKVDDTGLQVERTALAWRRTGLAHVATALLIVMRSGAPGALQLAAGLALAATGLLAMRNGHRIRLYALSGEHGSRNKAVEARGTKPGHALLLTAGTLAAVMFSSLAALGSY